MTRGVKQGCPLSAILFVFIFDLLLKALIRDLNLIDGVVVGVADDVAVALEDMDATSHCAQYSHDLDRSHVDGS